MARFWSTGRALAAMAACAPVLGGAGASAQTPPQPELFGLFKRVCADNGGVYARTIAAADVQSWTKVPFPLPIPTGDAKLSKKTIRAKPTPGGGYRMFFAGDGELNSKDARAPFQMCAIGAKPASFGAVVAQVQQWMRQPPVAGEKGMRSFRYHLAPDGLRTPLEPGKLRDLAPKLGPGSVISVDVAPQKDLTLISYSIIKL